MVHFSCASDMSRILGHRHDHMKFWELYGKCIKPGVHENSTNRTQIAELLRLGSTKSEKQQISVKE